MKTSSVRVGLGFLCVLGLSPAAHGAQLRSATGRFPGFGHHHRDSNDDLEMVRKPVTDRRDYAHKIFANGLNVLVVHDPDAEKSAFAMAVDVGSHEDPDDFQGLAHFCEHMLFLGSEKYPDEGVFARFLALHGGQDNAYTASEETVFFNEIGNDGFDEGMDMFAQFFIAPAFKEEMAGREIHAVDSEHKKNIPNMNWRIRQLLLSVASVENPMHKFATGDINTLKLEPEKNGKSVVQALHKFHGEHYCSSNMHLLLVSNMTTEALMKLGHKHFDAIPEANQDCVARGNYTDHPAYTHELGNLGLQFTVGTDGSPELWLSFPLPALDKHYKQLAEAYVWNALGHFGPGGLKAKLLEEDLSRSFSYYADNSAAGSVMFITFSLTAKGLKQWDSVLDLFFAYFSAIRLDGVDEMVLESIRQVRQVTFDYQESLPSGFDFVQSAAGGLPKYGPVDLLTGGVLIDDPDVDLIGTVLEAIVPDNMNVVLVNPKYNESTSSHHDPHYHFGYTRADLDEEQLQRWLQASSRDLAPPPVLKYAPTQLDIIKAGVGEGAKPEQLQDTSGVEAWWLGIGNVKLPKAVVTVKFGVPDGIIDSVEDVLLASLHVRLANQELESPSDALQTCGLGYSLSSQHNGFHVSFSGFDQHIGELMDLVFPVIRSPKGASKYFEAARRQMILDLSDVTKNQPFEHALEALDVVTLKGSYSRAQLLAAAKDEQLVSLKSYQNFLSKFFGSARSSALYAGNIDRSRAVAMSTIIGKAFELKETDKEEHDAQVLVLKPEQELEIDATNPIVGDENSATVVAYQFGIPTIADRVHFAILSEVISRPAFDALRTEHQLGYVVFAFATTHASIVEIRVLVQGASKSPDVVESLIEETVQNITGLISKMSQEEFEEHKASLRTELIKKDATMGEYALRHWAQISEQTYCFDKRHYQLEYLDSEAFKDPAPLLETWKRTVAPSSHRRKISVKLFAPEIGEKADASNALSPVKAAHHQGPHLIHLDREGLFQGEAHQTFWSTEYICEQPH